jgi:hypothetical protein|nr:MAG TPA: tailspike protein [Caudoviricetes sp.]
MSSGCGDVLSLADLQTAKKHQIFEAEVITGKSGGVAGGADIDYATNAVTGQTQKTLPAVLRGAGFSPVSWDFSTGGTLTVNDRDKVVYDPVSKTWYSYAGTLPVVVHASFNPVGNANWKPQTDPYLRDDLANTDDVQLGDAMVGVKSVLAGAVGRTLHSKVSDAVSIYDFGATWDGDIHPLSEKFSTLTAAQMVYPFVTSLDQSTDYAAIQAACNSKKTVLIPKGTGFVNSTIYFNNSVRIVGENTDGINRAQSFISVDGDISLFALAQGSSSGGTKMIQLFIDGLYIFYNPGDTPTVTTGNSGKIAFNFYSTEAGTTGLEMSEIKNCTVHGAWRCFSDTTGTYLTKLQNVWARNCHDGFIKALGTTILMETCYTSGCVSPYQFGAVMSVTMLNCAMDQSSITLSGGSFGGAGVHFVNSHSVNIVGFDAEGNIISTDGSGDATLFHFENTNGKISGLTAHQNQMKTVAPAASGVVSFIKASGTSQVIIDSSEDDLSENAIPYTGTGYPVTLYAKDATSRIDVYSGRWRAPAGGTPAISVVSQGNVNWFCTPISGLVSGGYTQQVSSTGLQTPGFYTAKGTQPVNARTQTTLFTLPNMQGMYLISVWASGSGTNYSSTQLAMYNGALALTPLKAGAFITFSASGRNVAITSQGTTTFNWTYTKLG